jgi:hypothetical protein
MLFKLVEAVVQFLVFPELLKTIFWRPANSLNVQSVIERSLNVRNILTKRWRDNEVYTSKGGPVLMLESFGELCVFHLLLLKMFFGKLKENIKLSRW